VLALHSSLSPEQSAVRHLQNDTPVEHSVVPGVFLLPNPHLKSMLATSRIWRECTPKEGLMQILVWSLLALCFGGGHMAAINKAVQSSDTEKNPSA
jgi:hypothetical protein